MIIAQIIGSLHSSRETFHENLLNLKSILFPEDGVIISKSNVKK